MNTRIKKNKLCFYKNGMESTSVNLDEIREDLIFLLKNMRKIDKFFVRYQKFFPRYFQTNGDGTLTYHFKYQHALISEKIIDELKRYYGIDDPEPFTFILFLNWWVILLPILMIVYSYIK